MKIWSVPGLCAALLSTAFLFLPGGSAVALRAKNIIAYPVPFNSNFHTLRFKYKDGTTPETLDRVRINIYDVNGDGVFSADYSSLAAIGWNGLNGNGKRAKPGLYLVKITIEYSATGEKDTGVIRILIVR